MNNSASCDADILSRIESARKTYYDDKPQNLVFKKQQKFDCAESVTNNIDLATVLPVLFRVDGNTIFVNYAVFKSIASPSIYMNMANYLFDTTQKIIESYSKYNLSLDLGGVTMSAIERYRAFVVLVSSEGMKNSRGLLKHLDLIYVHNPPTFVEYLCSIVIPIVDPSIKDRFIIYFKNGNVIKYMEK